ncbi:MAG TPA: cupin domain-containing protein [Fibrobacteria bacterium]|nr:cupin domain-containing protein [Fibrobacteria bacterium]
MKMPSANRRAETLIESLGLAPHPEGGYYREVHRAAERVRTGRGPRSALTTIYFLLLRGRKSVFHRVLSDEVWHYYEGAPLRLWRVAADFKTREALILGPTGGKAPKGPGAAQGSAQVAVIRCREWQAAESLGEYTLVGCSVGPGFDFADFKLLRDDARAAGKMRKAFPDLGGWI